MALCVSLCPAEELQTYQDLKRFAMVNGEVTTPQGEGLWQQGQRSDGKRSQQVKGSFIASQSLVLLRKRAAVCTLAITSP